MLRHPLASGGLIACVALVATLVTHGGQATSAAAQIISTVPGVDGNLPGECRSMADVPRAVLEPILRVPEAEQLLKSGGLMGLTMAKDGSLYFGARFLAPYLYRVDTLGGITGIPTSDEVQAILQSDFVGMRATTATHIAIWLIHSASAVAIRADGYLASRDALAAPPGPVDQVSFDSQGGLYLSHRPDSTRRVVRYFPVPVSMEDHEDVTLPHEGIVPLLLAENNGFNVTQPLPYHPVPLWVPLLNGQVAWTDAADFQLRRIGVDRQETFFCYADFVRAAVTSAEREEIESRMAWMSRFTDSNWVWTGPRVSDRQVAIEKLMADSEGNVWVLAPLASRLIPEGEGWPRFRRIKDSPLTRSVRQFELHRIDAGGRNAVRVQTPEWFDANLWVAQGEKVWAVLVDQASPDEKWELMQFRVVPAP
ncbi:MAG: hypothetical protein U0974_05970 [Gemmatimonadales bacterium]|nr:hypothetical protein [Gemmatimonadales bacterium]MDZ4389257.1 hypothetical protein [Gemmatimonadales bacterium]